MVSEDTPQDGAVTLWNYRHSVYFLRSYAGIFPRCIGKLATTTVAGKLAGSATPNPKTARRNLMERRAVSRA